MEVQEILKQCVVEENIIRLPQMQLERKTYLKIKKSLELIGGKWVGGKTKGFIFNENPEEYLKQLCEGENRNLKKEFQFFETPDFLADKLVSLADLKETHSILEPSAGQGAIIKSINRYLPSKTVDYCELMPLNRTFLKNIQTANFIGDDFLTINRKYDRIIANPPFSKNQDIDHVLKMYDCLNPGGKLISIMSNHWRQVDRKKEENFREFIHYKDAYVEDIEAGAFKDSGTNISSCVVVINKDMELENSNRNYLKQKKMKINVSRNHLYAKLRTVSRIVKPGKESMYSSFLFDININGETLTVTGADEQGQVKTGIECVIENAEDIQFLIDTSTLMSALKELSEQPLTISIEKKDNGANISLTYHNGKYELVGLDAELFPRMKQQKDAISTNMNSSLLRKGLNMGKFAANDTLRPVMGNINLLNKGNHIAFAASNGHFMGVYEEDTEPDSATDYDVNIPAKIAKIVSDMLPADDVKIVISFDERSICFIVEEFTISYRLFEGKYPNYRAIIPERSKNDEIVKANCDELIAAISRVSVFSDNSTSMIVLEIKDNILALSAQNIDYARSAKETLMLDQIYSNIQIGFKSNFLSDILKTIDTEMCEIHLSDPSRAAVFRTLNSNNATFLLMPMIINQ